MKTKLHWNSIPLHLEHQTLKISLATNVSNDMDTGNPCTLLVETWTNPRTVEVSQKSNNVDVPPVAQHSPVPTLLRPKTQGTSQKRGRNNVRAEEWGAALRNAVTRHNMVVAHMNAQKLWWPVQDKATEKNPRMIL